MIWVIFLNFEDISHKYFKVGRVKNFSHQVDYSRHISKIKETGNKLMQTREVYMKIFHHLYIQEFIF